MNPLTMSLKFGLRIGPMTCGMNNPMGLFFERAADDPSAPNFHYTTSPAICQAFFIRHFAQRIFPLSVQ
jgi:hypothetical protein